MITDSRFDDTPSIIHRPITNLRDGQSLRYGELTALEKRDYLFDQGIRPTAYENYPDEERPGVIHGLVQFGEEAIDSIANERLKDTMIRDGDELETPKPKLFHTYGTTAKVLFRPEGDNAYSGLLNQEAHGLARFSYAGPVIGVGVVPGLAIKFPLDGDHASENLIVMRKLDRQQPISGFLSTDSHNSVFQHPFTNILPDPRPTNVVMRVVNKRFERVVEDGKGLHLSTDNLARVSTSGEAVPDDAVSWPHRIILAPTGQARKASDPTIDFRDDLARHIPAGSTIYEVFALSSEQNRALERAGASELEDYLEGAKKIGSLTTESEFIASKYGDYRLFFKHSDRFLRPEHRP